MEGKVFKQRYQLKQKMGSGRLADTYVADDLQLNKQVAVKVVYEQIASNPSYIQKLEAELKVAAELDHPNITKTYDWGREDDLYFVITEFVEGRSLKSVLSTDGKLPPQRAARVASDVCGALELAHSRSLIHGGISTHNIFISEIGQVKLMDVGMAWTATGRGTPQYISPEQAQGLAVDARSDIYSLGIVLYDLLTGKVPFDDPNAETVISRQINEEPVAPSVIDPAIPANLNALVLKALAKDPALRFQSASEMKAALSRFLEGLAAAPAAAPAPEEKKSSLAWLWITLGVIGVLAIVGVILAIVFTGGDGTIEVPDIVGMSESQAQQALDNAGLKMETEEEYVTSPSQQVGVVVDQDPAAGDKVDEGDTVKATISAELDMPNVLGMTQSEAEDALDEAGLKSITINETPVTEPNMVGKVTAQNPQAGTPVTEDTRVTLEIGKESELTNVPNVVGLDQSDAESALKDAGLEVKVEEQQSPAVPEGRVISQNPSAGTNVAKGTTVTIVVSTASSGPSP
jgi:serine/threonine-protein kinase